MLARLSKRLSMVPPDFVTYPVPVRYLPPADVMALVDLTELTWKDDLAPLRDEAVLRKWTKNVGHKHYGLPLPPCRDTEVPSDRRV